MQKPKLVKNNLNKGFTLIEILAVIVILAIILLIAIPVILNIITNVRIGAFESSVKNIIRTSELTYTTNMLKGDNVRLEFYYEEKEESSNKIGAKLNYQGEKPDYGYIMITNNGKIKLALYNTNSKVCLSKDYNSNKLEMTKNISKDDCIEVLPTPTILLLVEDEEIDVAGEETVYMIPESDYKAYLSSGEETREVNIYINGIEKKEIDLRIPGRYEIIYRVIENELISEVSRIINIVDKIPPEITIVGANPLIITQGQAYEELGATALDNVDGDISNKIIIDGTLTTSIPGTYNISYKVKDASGNEAIETRTVVVEQGLVIQVSTGSDHTLFLMEDKTARAVGTNGFYQLGDGTKINKNKIIKIPNLSGIEKVIAGSQFTMLLMSDGTVKAVGRNYYGQLGDGTTVDKITLTTVPNLSGVKQVSTRYYYTVFLMNDGTVKTVGDNNYGQLGDGTKVNKITPITVPSLSGVKDISAGGYFTMFLMNDGTVKAVGDNSFGQLGDGTTVGKSTPITVPGLNGVEKISAGYGHVIFLMNDGTIKAVGGNSTGMLGDGTTVNKSTPITVPGLSGVKDISAGQNHTTFLMNDGTVKATGNNLSGQLGDGTTDDKITPITVMSGVKEAFAGDNYTIFLMEDGTVKSVGRNIGGQLGDGTTTNRLTPVDVIFE